jgi:hypothetical protein
MCSVNRRKDKAITEAHAEGRIRKNETEGKKWNKSTQE